MRKTLKKNNDWSDVKVIFFLFWIYGDSTTKNKPKRVIAGRYFNTRRKKEL